MKELISAYEFAKRKGVTPRSVYKRMLDAKNPNGDISYEVVGKSKYIDWEKFKIIKFKNGQ